MAENTVKMSIALEGDQALKTLAALTKSVDKFGDEAAGAVGKTDKVMNQFLGTLGAIGASKAIGFLTNQLNQSVTAAVGFEKSIAEINTLLPKNEKLTRKTTDAFLELSSAYGKDVQTQTRAFYDIVSAGVKGSAAQMDVLAQSNEAAIAGLVDVNTAADILTSSMNAYASSGLTAAQASDALFVAVREGKTTFGELAGALGQVAPTANAAGLEFSEMTGTLAAITKNGVSTAEAVTGLKAILSSIIKPTEEAKKAAKELGIEYSIAGIQKAGGFANFLGKVKEATNGNITSLSRLIPNIRGLGPAAGIVTGEMSGFNDILLKSENAMGATTKAAAIMKETMAFKLDQAKQSVTNLGIELFQTLSPAIKRTADFWANYVKELSAPAPIRSIQDVNAEMAKVEETIDSLTKTLLDQKDNSLFNSFLGDKANIEEQLGNSLEAFGKLKSEMKSLQDTADAEEAARVEANKSKKAADDQEEIDKTIEKFNLLKEIKLTNAAELAEFNALQKEEELSLESVDLIRLQDALGKEKALKEIARINEMSDETKQKDALKKLREKAIKEEQVGIISFTKWEDLSRKERLANLSSTLGAVSALQSSNNAVLFNIGKAAALAEHGLNVPKAISTAMSSAPPPFNFALAALVGTAMAAQGVKIATAKPPSAGSFAEGGLITGGSSVNDRLTANVNAGETILNRRQSNTVFRAIDQGNVGGGGSSVVINNPMILDQGGIDEIIDQINDAVEFRNKELRAS